MRPATNSPKQGAMLLDLPARGVEQQVLEFAAPGSMHDQSPLIGPVACDNASAEVIMRTAKITQV